MLTFCWYFLKLILGRDSESENFPRLVFDFVIYPKKKLLWQAELNPWVRCAFGNAYYDNIIAITTGIELVRSHSLLNERKVLANIWRVPNWFPWFVISEYETSQRMTFTDFLASLGGIFGLYLGFSILSFVEIIYWFTFMLITNVRQ